MFCALLTSRYQVSVYRTNGPLVSIGFRSQAANDLKYQQFSLFPIEKPKLPNLTLS